MLVITRRENQNILVNTSDGPIIITYVRAAGGKTVRIGIDAPKQCQVIRGELLAKGLDITNG